MSFFNKAKTQYCIDTLQLENAKVHTLEDNQGYVIELKRAIGKVRLNLISGGFDLNIYNPKIQKLRDMVVLPDERQINLRKEGWILFNNGESKFLHTLSYSSPLASATYEETLPYVEEFKDLYQQEILPEIEKLNSFSKIYNEIELGLIRTKYSGAFQSKLLTRLILKALVHAPDYPICREMFHHLYIDRHYMFLRPPTKDPIPFIEALDKEYEASEGVYDDVYQGESKYYMGNEEILRIRLEKLKDEKAQELKSLEKHKYWNENPKEFEAEKLKGGFAGADENYLEDIIQRSIPQRIKRLQEKIDFFQTLYDIVKTDPLMPMDELREKFTKALGVSFNEMLKKALGYGAELEHGEMGGYNPWIRQAHHKALNKEPYGTDIIEPAPLLEIE